MDQDQVYEGPSLGRLTSMREWGHIVVYGPPPFVSPQLLCMSWAQSRPRNGSALVGGGEVNPFLCSRSPPLSDTRILHIAPLASSYLVVLMLDKSYCACSFVSSSLTFFSLSPAQLHLHAHWYFKGFSPWIPSQLQMLEISHPCSIALAQCDTSS